MKFNFFHLMPYPYLPDEYDDFPASALIWPNKHFDPKLGRDLYHRYLDELEHADQVGFDGIVVNEHHQTMYGLMPSPNIIVGALSRRTSNAKILVLGNQIALRRNPIRVAEELAMLDHLSDGRLISGFVRGIGWEYFNQNVDPNQSRGRFNEAHDLIVKAWTSDEIFDWYGEHYEFRYVNIWPKPLQSPHPPIYVPGTGSADTMRFCARNHYPYSAVFAPAKVVGKWFDTYRDACEEEGYKADPEDIGFTVPVIVADTDEEAYKLGKQHVEWLFHKGLRLEIPAILNPPGYVTPKSFEGLLRSGVKYFQEITYDELLDLGYAIVGSPATVGDKIEALRQDLGFGAFSGLFSVGDMAAEDVKRSTDLFAEQVMPRFRTAAAGAAAGAAA
ncbi:Limonene 1,2-monooxygenase [Baekduia alba]|uniref:LLM class flavin-dependent oxidoreductase n=1 Tax=Baekduia alba TaxID=2997333 RepID=UPI002341FC0F|nr:LLM class flavin-dependent oxidoreductase [Baekduia alba]WCB95264.1 Limonene 1,2-monooxygenase [Baekduia alba]